MTPSRSAPSSRIQHSRQPCISIHILDDDSLLNLFSLFRPSVFEDNQDDSIPRGSWLRERWWYKLVHVCQRWRYLILGSVSHLGLCLVCTRGTPVADMLAHSPTLPLIIGYEDENHDLTAKDKRGIMLALQHRNRVRRIYFRMPVPSLQKFITAIDGDFPTLELLHIGPPTKPNIYLTLPPTFEAPQIRHLILDRFTSPIGSPFLTSAVGLVTLLCRIYPSTYPHPNHLLQTLSLLPQLERLKIGFLYPVPNRERQMLLTPITTRVTLPNLRRFSFRGISAYFDAFLPHMTTPRLESLSVYFLNQHSFSIPSLLQFMCTTENLTFTIARFSFYHEAVAVRLYPRVASLPNFCVKVFCRHLERQVSSVSQVFNTLCPLFSSVVDLTLDYKGHSLSPPEWHNEVDSARWRELLGSFRNVRTLHVHSGLISEVSRSLRLYGKPLLEPLPELKQPDNTARYGGDPAPMYDNTNYAVVLNNLLRGHETGNLTPYFQYVMTREGRDDAPTHIATAKFRGVVCAEGRDMYRGAAKRAAAKKVYEYFLANGVPGMAEGA